MAYPELDLQLTGFKLKLNILLMSFSTIFCILESNSSTVLFLCWNLFLFLCFYTNALVSFDYYRMCMYVIWAWLKHILFMTEHDKGLGRAKKLCLALSLFGLVIYL